jgi:hypothetical protein
MHTTPLGNPSTKVGPAFTWKRKLRMERICRLEMAHFTEDEIAFSVGVTKVRVNQIKRTPEYIALRLQIATGVVAEADRQMYDDLSENHDLVKEMVPEAMLAIRDALLDKSQPALRLKAAQDLLDREGSLVKISKTEIKKNVVYDFEQHKEVSENLLAVLQQSNGMSLEAMGLSEFSQNAMDVKSQDQNIQKAFDLIDKAADTIQ